MLHIQTTQSFNAAQIILYDTEGRSVLQKDFSKSTTLNIARLVHGIYFYVVLNAKGKEIRGKLLKQ